MKNLVYTIIGIIIFFSIFNYSTANYGGVNNKEGYIEKLLDLNYGIEEYKFQINDLEYIYFYDINSQKMYDDFRTAEQTLKSEFLRKYRNGEIDYYTMNGIVKNFNLFVYHTNKLFKYISIKEIKSDYKELDIAILKNYENSRSYYYKTKLLIK